MAKKNGSVACGEQVVQVIVACGPTAERVLRKFAHPSENGNPVNHRREFEPWKILGSPGSPNGRQEYRPFVSDGIVKRAATDGTVRHFTLVLLNEGYLALLTKYPEQLRVEREGTNGHCGRGVLRLRDSDQRKPPLRPELQNGVLTISIWKNMPQERDATFANQLAALLFRGNGWTDRNGKQYPSPYGDEPLPKRRDYRQVRSGWRRSYLGLV